MNYIVKTITDVRPFRFYYFIRIERNIYLRSHLCFPILKLAKQECGLLKFNFEQKSLNHYCKCMTKPHNYEVKIVIEHSKCVQS